MSQGSSQSQLRPYRPRSVTPVQFAEESEFARSSGTDAVAVSVWQRTTVNASDTASIFGGTEGSTACPTPTSPNNATITEVKPISTAKPPQLSAPTPQRNRRCLSSAHATSSPDTLTTRDSVRLPGGALHNGQVSGTFRAGNLLETKVHPI